MLFLAVPEKDTLGEAQAPSDIDNIYRDSIRGQPLISFLGRPPLK